MNGKSSAPATIGAHDAALFLHVHHDGVERDRDGTELADKHVAWEEATKAAGEIIRHIDGGLRPGHDWRMEVTDEFANPLWELHVKAQRK